MPRVHPSQIYRHVDWEHVSNALLYYALRLFNGNDPIPGLGIGAEDFAEEVIGRLWDPDDRVEFNSRKFGKPTTESVVRYLKEVLKNRFLDYLKRAAHRHESQDELIEDTGSDEETEWRFIVLSRVERSIENARERGDIEAELYLTLQIESYHNAEKPLTNAQAASEMGLGPSDVVNVKKRIQRMDLQTTTTTTKSE